MKKIFDKVVENLRAAKTDKAAAELRRKILFHYYDIERNKLEIQIAEEKLKSIGYEDNPFSEIESQEEEERTYPEANTGEAV